MTGSIAKHLCWISIASFSSTALCGTPPQLADFADAHELEKDIEAFCLKQPVLNTPAETDILESTTRLSHGVRFESIRFETTKEGLGTSPDCTGMREIILAVDNGKEKGSKLFDSGFYLPAYCDDPFRYWQPPIAYEMEEAIGKTKRKLAVVELETSVLPCPNIEYVRSRRYLFFDLENSNKLFLDVEADFVVPELGTSPYRLNLFNVLKVIRSSSEVPPNQIPDAIEIADGQFSVRMTTTRENYVAPREESRKGRIKLDSIYSKDQKHVYIHTVDVSGVIQGADPSSFQLLDNHDDSAYTKDSRTVFFFGEAIPSADAKTFIQLNARYGKDIRHVYFMERLVPNADVASFVAPFKSVWYAKDKDHVFSGSNIFPQADPATFSTGDDRSCGGSCRYRYEDKNYRYDVSERIVQRVAAPTTSK